MSMKSYVTSKVGRAVLVGQKHSPAILFGVGIVGVVATTVTACKATLRYDDEMKDVNTKIEQVRTLHSAQYSEKDRNHDLAVLYVRKTVQLGKLYGPSIVLGSLSVAALAGSHNILSKRNAGLMSAYAAVDKAFSEYRDRVASEVGIEKEKELRYGSVEKTVITEDTNGPKKEKVKSFSNTDASPYARLFNQYNQNYEPTPEYNVMFLRSQQNYANHLLNSRGHVFLNDVYDMLGMDRRPAGSQVGWLKDGGPDGSGDGYIDFGIFSDEDMSRMFDFVTGREGEILLDFNVDGVIWDKI